MHIVLLKNDMIETNDGASYVVESYTNFKQKGPAVYVSTEVPTARPHVVYFFDVAKVNGTKVDFDPSSKTLRALGPTKRRINLPQPGDVVTVDTKDGLVETTVKDLKLHSKSIGISKGLVLRDDDRAVYSLKQVVEVKRTIGSSEFDRKRFVRMYREYVGYSGE